MTDDMLRRAIAERNDWDLCDGPVSMRAVLEAALADVPEPDAIVKACDMACRGVEADLAKEQARVAKLETRLSDVCALLRNTKGDYVEKAWLAFVLGDEP